MLTNTASAWAHLPNAVHIDRVLASLRSHPAEWAKEEDTSRNVDRRGAAALIGVWIVSWDAMIALERRVEWLEVEAVARTIACDNEWNRAWDALLCLVAYDDCVYLFDAEVGDLKILAALGSHKAISLLPACIALNAIKNSS